MLHIKVNTITKFSDMVANILPADTPSLYVPWGIVAKLQNSNFSEHGHVAYKIKENHEFSNMVEKYFFRRSPPCLHPDPGDRVERSKFNFFSTMSCCI